MPSSTEKQALRKQDLRARKAELAGRQPGKRGRPRKAGIVAVIPAAVPARGSMAPHPLCDTSATDPCPRSMSLSSSSSLSAPAPEPLLHALSPALSPGASSATSSLSEQLLGVLQVTRSMLQHTAMLDPVGFFVRVNLGRAHGHTVAQVVSRDGEKLGVRRPNMQTCAVKCALVSNTSFSADELANLEHMLSLAAFDVSLSSVLRMLHDKERTMQ